MNHSLVATGLGKRYRNVTALDGFDLTVTSGSIHGLLGPNGAGKSTAVKALSTLISFDEGTATIGGHDVRTSAARVRREIGLVGQSPAVDEILNGRQNLVMFGRLFGLGKRAATARADELLDQFGLIEAASRAVSAYSGGMRRRLDIAASLILRPSVLFLDEPTTGLDPRGRNEVWVGIREVSAAGTTVLLTTQYLDEADKLADRISVMNHGAVIAEGTPDELKRETAPDLLEVSVSDPSRLAEAVEIIGRVTGSIATEDPDSASASATAHGAASLVEAVRQFDSAGIVLDDLSIRRPTLDEVFLTLTGADERTVSV
ncbi:daunorubicin resistance protein DrrA family ABC transporter ATP-binding protein [Okibacterium endophyticum]